MATLNINFWAVFALSIIATIIGFAWHSPMIFGKSLQKLNGVSEKEIKTHKITSYHIAIFISLIATSYTLAFFIKAFGANEPFESAQIGFRTWLGLITATNLCEYLFFKKSKRPFLLTPDITLLVS